MKPVPTGDEASAQIAHIRELTRQRYYRMKAARQKKELEKKQQKIARTAA